MLLILAVTVHNIPEGLAVGQCCALTLFIIPVNVYSLAFYVVIFCFPIHYCSLIIGVGFGSVGKSEAATFETAFNLALGIGLQNFPEGLAVSLPLAAFGKRVL